MDKNNSNLSNEEVRHIAALANLKLSEGEIEKFHLQLSEILNYIDLLQDIDTVDITPLAQVTSLTNVARSDEIKPSLSSAEALSQTRETIKAPRANARGILSSFAPTAVGVLKGSFRVKAVFKNR